MALVKGRVDTSAPVLLRAGFRKYGEVRAYRLARACSSEVWDRATSTQPVPDAGFVVATGVVALVLVLLPATWPRVRLGVTVVHEAGPRAGRPCSSAAGSSSIRLHSDTSGLTVSRGKPRGPGMVAMLAAGYLAPAVLGLVAALLLANGRSVGLLWLLVVLGRRADPVGAQRLRPPGPAARWRRRPPAHVVRRRHRPVRRGVPHRLAAPPGRTAPTGRAARRGPAPRPDLGPRPARRAHPRARPCSGSCCSCWPTWPGWSSA